VGKVHGPPSAGTLEFQAKNESQFTTIYVVWASCARGKTLTDLEILGCDCAQKCAWRPEPAGGAIGLARSLAFIRGGPGGRELEGKGWQYSKEMNKRREGRT